MSASRRRSLVNGHVVAHRAGSTPEGSVVIGRAKTNHSGRYTLRSLRTTGADVLYLTTFGGRRSGRAVPARFELTTAIGRNRPHTVGLNELTTVAAGFSMAQFLDGGSVGGANPGLANAAAMARNLVNPATGKVSALMGKAPNGARTATLATLNTLADVIAGCARSGLTCDQLTVLATPAGGSRPGTSLQALADVASNPANNAQAIFNLQRGLRVYKPRLKNAPGSWIWAIKFVGNGHQFDGPGNMAFDAKGDGWTTVNYQNSVKPKNVCASETLAKLRPYSKNATVDMYRGGGLDGAGFGIGIDPNGRVWVGNFGFKGSKCEATPTSDSVPVFSPNGNPLSGASGITAGADDVWVANFGGKRLSKFCGARAGSCPPGIATGQPISPPSGCGFNGLQRNTGVQIDASGNV